MAARRGVYIVCLLLSIPCAFAQGIGSQGSVDEAPLPVDHDKSYARAGSSGMVITGANSWYLEEFDSLERPVSATTWASGKIAKKVSFVYYGDTQLIDTKIETVDSGSTVSRFDRSGNVLLVMERDAEGEILNSTVNTYTRELRLETTTRTEGDTVKRTTYIYGPEGTLLEKRAYTNDMLDIVYRWKDEENWTETVYSKGKAVLVARYVNGQRVKEANAKKQ